MAALAVGGVIHLRLDLSDWSRALDRLQAKAPVAIGRSLSRAGTTVRATMARAIAQDTGLGVTPVKNAIEIKLNVDTPIGQENVRVSITGPRVPLIEFKAKGPEPSRGRGAGVTARLPGGAGRYPRAFIATMRSGHRGVFQRAGLDVGSARARRLPIYELRGPSLARVFTKYRPIGFAAGREALIANLQHEFRWAIQEAAAGRS